MEISDYEEIQDVLNMRVLNPQQREAVRSILRNLPMQTLAPLPANILQFPGRRCANSK